MAGPLGFLRLGARILEPIIRGAVYLGRNVLEITRDALAAGVRGLDREIAAITRAEETIKLGTGIIVGEGDTALPDIAGIPEAITLQRREFSYTVGVTGIDPLTGRKITRYINVSTDRLLTPGEAKDEALRVAMEEYNQDKNLIVKTELTTITRAAPGRRL